MEAFYEYGLVNDVRPDEEQRVGRLNEWLLVPFAVYRNEFDAVTQMGNFNTERQKARQVGTAFDLDRILRRPVDVRLCQRRVVIWPWEDYTPSY